MSLILGILCHHTSQFRTVPTVRGKLPKSRRDPNEKWLELNRPIRILLVYTLIFPHGEYIFCSFKQMSTGK